MSEPEQKNKRRVIWDLVNHLQDLGIHLNGMGIHFSILNTGVIWSYLAFKRTPLGLPWWRSG